ncbi:MAG: hypothetical protein KGY61_12740 [Desulfobacterales bacterium]|nr:hypothetical protein [Desulfobacterales bacterium]
MRFLLLLTILSAKFKKAAEQNANFQKFLMGHECSVVIKTRDNAKGRRFVFKEGRFSTDRKLDQYDAAMIWANAGTAFKAMKKGDEGVTEALQSHRLAIDGKLHSFTWFGAAIKFVMAS